MRGLTHFRIARRVVARGILGDWLDAWDDYRWTPDEFLDGPGETVIVSGVESARGRDSGIDVLSRRVTGVFEVRDRKIVRFKAYLDRHEALEAAGVRE